MMSHSNAECDREAGSVSFVVGDAFDSFDELNATMKKYEECRSVQMTRRDSYLLKSAKIRVPKKMEKANERLKYYYLKYTCSFGGKPYRWEGKGIRRRQTYAGRHPGIVSLVIASLQYF